MTEFWLISAPGEKTCQQTWERLNNATAKMQNLSINYKFYIPDLKVGTLDVLIGLSDELGKLDGYVESVTRKLSHYMGDVLEDTKDKLEENLRVNGVTPVAYLTRFQWDPAKYPVKQSLKNISEIISRQVTQIDADLKTKAQSYNNIKGNLLNLERKQTGSLLTRNLGDLVKKDDFIISSEYFTTLLVVIPSALYHDWEAKYETMTDMIVPRSSKHIYQDNDSGLFTVSMFTKVVEEFKQKARENRFVVRDFLYDEEALTAGKNEISKLQSDKKKLYGPLVRWLKVNFSEAFMAWVHVKALRVFVESVLRYGLPVNFQAMLLQPNRKTTRKLRDTLTTLYRHLDSMAISGPEIAEDIPGMAAQQEYYPYVYYELRLDFLEKQNTSR